MKREIVADIEWPENAVIYFDQLVNESTLSVRFTPRFKNVANGQYFGDLNVITYAGKTKSCSTKLIKHGYATMSQNFIQGEYHFVKWSIEFHTPRNPDIIFFGCHLV